VLIVAVIQIVIVVVVVVVVKLVLVVVVVVVVSGSLMICFAWLSLSYGCWGGGQMCLRVTSNIVPPRAKRSKWL